MHIYSLNKNTFVATNTTNFAKVNIYLGQFCFLTNLS